MTIKKGVMFTMAWVLGAGVAAGAWQPVSAQGRVFAYPKAGQSAQQQQRDNAECNRWAVNESGFDPSRQQTYVTQGYSSPPPSGGGGVFGRGSYGQGGGISDAGRGAALGALGGAIAGNAGKGAAIGALSGLFIGGVKRSNQAYERERWEEQQRAQRRAQEQAIAQQRGQGMNGYNRAFSLCMESRKYAIQ